MFNKKVWFITGASRGFGRVWSEAALKAGDNVVATARDPRALSGLVETYGDAVLPLQLDVSDRGAATTAVHKGHAHFGRLDVLINNAGIGLIGAVEETAVDDVKSIFDVNMFGPLWVIQAALPLLRAQRSGHILAVSSLGGLVGFPMVGVYGAAKFAIEGLCEALAQEVAEFGIKVTIIEPGPYNTEFTPVSTKLTTPMAIYNPLREGLFAVFTPDTLGNPAATGPAILEVVNAENPPLRLILGTIALTPIRKAYSDRLSTWKEWEHVSTAAQGA